MLVDAVGALVGGAAVRRFGQAPSELIEPDSDPDSDAETAPVHPTDTP